MKVTSTLSPLFIAMAATIAPGVQAADEASPEGLVEGASLKLNARNYYMHRNRQQQADDNIEWGQGFLGIFESGYTQVTVGFGLDANAMLGLKLDGGGGTDGSSILPVSDGNGKAPNEFFAHWIIPLRIPIATAWLIVSAPNRSRMFRHCFLIV